MYSFVTEYSLNMNFMGQNMWEVYYKKNTVIVTTCSVSWKKYCILNQLHRLFTEFEL